MESPFAVLGIDPDADESAVKQAYRERVKEAHPDHGGSVEEFRAVRTAYERIKDGSWEENGVRAVDEARPASSSQKTGSAQETGTAQGTGDNPRAGGQRAAGGQREAGGPSGTRHRDGRSPSDAASQGPAGSDASDLYSQVTYLNYDVLTDYDWETTDEDLFEKAADADLDAADYGEFRADRSQSLLEAAEDEGFEWPFACRGGACANCAILLYEGELAMPGNHVLPTDMMERDIRLSCNGTPVSDELKVVYNVKHIPELEDLLLPPQPFERAYSDD
jgi:ferredoxin